MFEVMWWYSCDASAGTTWWNDAPHQTQINTKLSFLHKQLCLSLSHILRPRHKRLENHSRSGQSLFQLFKSKMQNHKNTGSVFSTKWNRPGGMVEIISVTWKLSWPSGWMGLAHTLYPFIHPSSLPSSSPPALHYLLLTQRLISPDTNIECFLS